MVYSHFLLTDCLSSCAISSANGVFTLPVTHGPFLLSIIFTQQSILQRQQLDSASRKMTKSWSPILPIHNTDSSSFTCCHGASFHIFLHYCINMPLHSITHSEEMKGKVLPRFIFILISLYAQRLFEQVVIKGIFFFF